jgi:hypothetical protein
MMPDFHRHVGVDDDRHHHCCCCCYGCVVDSFFLYDIIIWLIGMLYVVSSDVEML